MRILCTNDDGYLATGLNVLAAAARPLGEVSIVAPDREQSATSHSLTLHHPLRARRARDGAIVVDGTPTDCVILAVGELLESRPDIVFSGVNHGPNMGEDVLYSGTVAAAMEATVLGIPAVAVSYTGTHYEEIPAWEDTLTRLFRGIVEAGDFPAHTLFSVNLPGVDPAEVRGVRVTSLGKRRYSDSLTRALDPPEGLHEHRALGLNRQICPVKFGHRNLWDPPPCRPLRDIPGAEDEFYRGPV